MDIEIMKGDQEELEFAQQFYSQRGFQTRIVKVNAVSRDFFGAGQHHYHDEFILVGDEEVEADQGLVLERMKYMTRFYEQRIERYEKK